MKQIKINLGSGRFNLEGFINVDAVAEHTHPSGAKVEPDVNRDILEHLEDTHSESVHFIYAGHVLEHLDNDKLGKVLANASRVLKPGGSIQVTIPDAGKAIRLHEIGLLDNNTLVGAVMGECSNEFEYHRQVLTATIMQKILESHFRVVMHRNSTPYAPAQVNWQSTLEAWK